VANGNTESGIGSNSAAGSGEVFLNWVASDLSRYLNLSKLVWEGVVLTRPGMTGWRVRRLLMDSRRVLMKAPRLVWAVFGVASVAGLSPASLLKRGAPPVW